MEYSKRLPDTEFEVMQAIWELTPPVTTSILMKKIGNEKGWKAPTLISFLVRLEERGYIRSEKLGKERLYYPEADKDEYIRIITENFINKYHNGSFVNMMNCLYKDRKLSSEDIDNLLEWLKTRY